MPANIWIHWWQANQHAIRFGFIAGIVWGFLLTGSVTPREWLVYDQPQGMVYQYQVGIAPVAIPAEQFLMSYTITLVQLTLILLAVSGFAGWATWQLTRLRPRGETQLPLRLGWDAYVMALALGGLLYVYVFRQLGWASWFKGPLPTLAKVTSVTLELALPLYMGLALFLVWFLRLKSICAPDWETHYPKPEKKLSGTPRFRGWRTQGGKDPSKH